MWGWGTDAVLALVGLLASQTLYFTTPSVDAARPGACQPDSEWRVPCIDLQWARIYSQPRWATWMLVGQHPASAPGNTDSFTVEVGDDPTGFRVTFVDSSGNESCPSNIVQVNGGAGVETMPPHLWLGLPYPNPAKGLVAVPFCLPEAGAASLEVFDLHGARRAVLRAYGGVTASQVALWRANGEPPGIYLVRLTAGRWHAIRRVVVIR